MCTVTNTSTASHFKTWIYVLLPSSCIYKGLTTHGWLVLPWVWSVFTAINAAGLNRLLCGYQHQLHPRSSDSFLLNSGFTCRWPQRTLKWAPALELHLIFAQLSLSFRLCTLLTSTSSYKSATTNIYCAHSHVLTRPQRIARLLALYASVA